jgi:hypothetical protein
MNLRSSLKKISILKWPVSFFRSIRRKQSVAKVIREFAEFSRDWHMYKKLPQNPSFALATRNLYPRLFDKTTTTALDPVYFYQNSWCAKKIFEHKPTSHIDVGSDAKFVGIISQYVPTTMVDIRPLPLTLPGLSFIEGSILSLPFKSGTISSLSSICVIEHIGLGRYGDPLDPFGSEKAAQELTRVLSVGGMLYISVPVDQHNTVYFNAHRAFTREYILKLFDKLVVVEEKYVHGTNMYDTYDAKKGPGTGLYCFKKM